MSTETRTGPPAGVETDICKWCQEEIYDGREESGYTGEGPDWASGIIINGEWIGGDFGCDSHPISGEDGCGPHETEADVLDIITRYHLGTLPVRMCAWTSNDGQCGMQDGHEGDHLPVPSGARPWGCNHPDDEDHNHTCTCSDHGISLTDGCIKCDPDDYCVMERDEDGEPVAWLPRCTFTNMGVQCVRWLNHDGDHQSPVGAVFSQTDTIRSGEINTVDDLVAFLHPMVTTPNNMPVKVRARPEGYSGDSALRSVRWVEVVMDDENDDRHVEIVGY